MARVSHESLATHSVVSPASAWSQGLGLWIVIQSDLPLPVDIAGSRLVIVNAFAVDRRLPLAGDR